MKKSKLKSLAKMVVCIMSVCVAASCTSDQFFGIEEETDGTSYSTLNKIAQSKEFIEFQKQSFLSTEEMCNIDTTQKVLFDYFKGKPVYLIGDAHTIRPYLDARQKLVEAYPEYENTTIDEKNQIFNLAIMNNKSLRELAERCIPKALINRTKSINYESYAVIYTRSHPGKFEKLSEADGGTWAVLPDYTWYTRDDYMTAVNMAISESENTGLERGGLVFYDYSGIMQVKPNLVPGEIDLWYYPDITNQYAPQADFHTHPSGNLQPSETDYNSWSFVPWGIHMIYNCNGDYWVYGW